MGARFEMREPEGPWPGHHPKYETLVMRGPRSFSLTARLASGERIDVPFGRLTLDIRVDPPRP